MKIERLSNNDLIVYIFSNIEYNSNIDEILERIKRITKINGFYKVIVNIKSIGYFIKLIKIEDSYYKDTFDYKVVYTNEDIYYKTEDFFILADYSKVRCSNGYYYVLVDDCFDKILEKIEFGEFVFGNKELLKNSCIV